MIVAGPEGFRKNQYRKFNIRSADLSPGDDFGMVREVLQRRFRRLLAEAPRVSPHGDTPPLERGWSDREAIPVGVRAASPEHEESVDDLMPQATPTRSSSPLASTIDLPLSGGGQSGETADDDTDSPWPDLILIDGGAGQLQAARATLDELGIADIPVAAIAKGPDRDAGRETLFLPGRAPFKLPPRDPLLYFVERLRDEAHRFALGSHRQRRQRNIREAGLQEIPGIGPTRKRALLHHFGTLKAIERASHSDLAQVPGISAETARKIYDFFHETKP
jgi:excinuclease ABC subunit C